VGGRFVSQLKWSARRYLGAMLADLLVAAGVLVVVHVTPAGADTATATAFTGDDFGTAGTTA
jgi:hypothetical protein